MSDDETDRRFTKHRMVNPIIDNLIRGVSTAQINKALSATGISPSIAKEWIQQLAHHQTVQQSLQSTRPLRQSDSPSTQT